MLVKLLLAVPAAAILLLGMEAAVRIVAALRRRDYRHYEDRSGADIRANIALPNNASDVWPERLNPIAQKFRAAHEKAILEQGKYHASVIRSATCLAVTFCALAVSTTPQYRDDLWHLATIWFELLALMLLLYHWWIGARANRTWIADRIQAELLRQDQFIALLLPGQVVVDSAADAKRALIASSESLHVVDAIGAYWTVRRNAIAAAPIAATDVTGASLLSYLQKRPVRQLGWFSDAIARLEHNAHARGRRLAVLFGAALGLAALKLVLAMIHDPSLDHAPVATGLASVLEAITTPALVIVTGWSATEAAYYLNQNARSLIHRYRNQLSRMTHWFARAKVELPLDALPAAELDDAMKQKARALALEFEDLMIEELIDWIYIAKLDAIEIAP